ncbi:hypothetical protein NDI89_10320 [Natrinema sp. S1CR25-10]|uniref:Uncharacterized protein n=1 Tax=Natrinema salsiterrestre TaxID=2950540 RepID=A0A9Q4L643_9EURY|nr:hypothetical protein [Natrinema salsiterrestre]
MYGEGKTVSRERNNTIANPTTTTLWRTVFGICPEKEIILYAIVTEPVMVMKTIMSPNTRKYISEYEAKKYRPKIPARVINEIVKYGSKPFVLLVRVPFFFKMAHKRRSPVSPKKTTLELNSFRNIVMTLPPIAASDSLLELTEDAAVPSATKYVTALEIAYSTTPPKKS